jgi:adenine-specific DNA-methyltransferase
MSRELLQSVIDSFDLQKLKRFFSVKNSKFRPIEESFDYYNTDNFYEGLKLGEVSLDDGTLIVCAFKTKQELSERSGKKAQYDLGKKILKETQNDAGIFVFYNKEGNFRFSLIYANYLGKKRDWSTFRRFTYFVGKDLTNKTFKQRVGDSYFSSLEKIKDAFSVEKVTKEFYVDIANWYFWAVQNSKFPKDAEAEENGKNIAVIRLITRMIFIWFMRERGLIPKDLFNRKEINNILKDISLEVTTYYLAILQNLFFATLNTKRNFHKDLDFKKQDKSTYGAYYGYHYLDLFKDSYKLREYFGDIPFLNGGLFECLDDDSNGIIIDGFSDNQKNQPLVPNKLFFSEETEANLNTEYGTKNKSYKVRGLINTLSLYNFTIDENELDDQEVALDPELLGRVFENLLASFNPETSTTARKATGSYYTPREIVDYMVTESLKAYFKTHLPDISDLDNKLAQLFSKGSENNPFSNQESKKIVELIESVKIVDPAVGSGAFPMGALNKMVFILNKVDPGNELWKQAQLEAVKAMPDPQLRQNTKNQIEEFFKGKNDDYGRKLYLIQKCIYGVDVQQIAVEIAKLRFFISLLVDEKIDEEKENYGIQALPNLDFKLMRGNSLQSVETEDLFGSCNKKRLEELKEQLFFEPDQNKKKAIKLEVDRLFNELTDNKRLFDFELYFSEVFNQNGSDDVGFDIVLANPPYVGEKGHKHLFHEVKKCKLGRFFLGKMDYFYFFFHLALDIGKINAQVAFITTNYYTTALGAKKLREDLKNRAIILELINFNELKIFEAALGQHNMITILKKGQNDSFFAKTSITKRTGVATPSILESIVSEQDDKTQYFKVAQKNIYDGIESYIRINGIFTDDEGDLSLKILEKIKNGSKELGIVCNVKVGLRTGLDKVQKNHLNIDSKLKLNEGVFIISKARANQIPQKEKSLIKPLFKNSDIHRYFTQKDTDKFVIYSTNQTNIEAFPTIYNHIIKFKNLIFKIRWGENVQWYSIVRSRDERIFLSPKIVCAHRSKRNDFGYNEVPWYASSDVYFITQREASISLKYVIGLLNSNLYYFWLLNRGKRKGDSLELYQKPLSEIPIKIIPESEQLPLIKIVDKILTITNSRDYLEDCAKKEEVIKYEKLINQMIYSLYNLNSKEIEIVENSSQK